ncbi:MAG: purine-nucleoside phosphorylase [Bacteroidales bacterium]
MIYERTTEITAFIKAKTNNFAPEIGIILGTGLGNIVHELQILYQINYADIPHFPISTVKGHEGKLLFAQNEQGKKIIIMQGRFHAYEGYTMQEVTLPIYVMKFLGVKTLLVSNAAGGMNPNFQIGDIMLITDHINLMAFNPLILPNDERLGTRFPSMHQAYNKDLLTKAEEVAQQMGIRIVHGVYAALIGPCYETPAEYRYLRIIGADAVGMSTVPEVIIANYLEMKVLGISVISDLGGGAETQAISHEEVLKAVDKAVPYLVNLVKGVIEQI